MNKLTEVGCQLLIGTENHHPEIVSIQTGVPATNLLVKGSAYKNSKGTIIQEKINEENLWIYKTEKFQNQSIEFAILSLIEMIDANKPNFEIIFNKFPSYHALCYCYFFSDINPFFQLSTSLIHKLSEYNMHIDFDLYILNSNN